jgi:hypothetical protein
MKSPNTFIISKYLSSGAVEWLKSDRKTTRWTGSVDDAARFPTKDSAQTATNQEKLDAEYSGDLTSIFLVEPLSHRRVNT